MRRVLVLLALLALLVVSTAARAIDVTNEITPENILRLMNDTRIEHGLAPLRVDGVIENAAADRMRDMADGGWWSHRSPDGVSPFSWLSARGYRYSNAGENLANGFETANVLVTSWMESPGHRANILDANFEDCGIAILDGSTKGPAIGKSVVVVFGRRLR